MDDDFRAQSPAEVVFHRGDLRGSLGGRTPPAATRRRHIAKFVFILVAAKDFFDLRLDSTNTQPLLHHFASQPHLLWLIPNWQQGPGMSH